MTFPHSWEATYEASSPPGLRGPCWSWGGRGRRHPEGSGRCGLGDSLGAPAHPRFCCSMSLASALASCCCRLAHGFQRAWRARLPGLTFLSNVTAAEGKAAPPGPRRHPGRAPPPPAPADVGHRQRPCGGEVALRDGEFGLRGARGRPGTPEREGASRPPSRRFSAPVMRPHACAGRLGNSLPDPPLGRKSGIRPAGAGLHAREAGLSGADPSGRGAPGVWSTVGEPHGPGVCFGVNGLAPWREGTSLSSVTPGW